MKSFNKFLQTNTPRTLKELAVQAERDLLWSGYPDKNTARNICARIKTSTDETLQENSEGGLKKWLWKTLDMIEKEKENTFTTFKFFLDNLSIYSPNKRVISKRDYINYMDDGSVEDFKGQIPKYKIDYIFNRALEEKIISIHGKNFIINCKENS